MTQRYGLHWRLPITFAIQIKKIVCLVNIHNYINTFFTIFFLTGQFGKHQLFIKVDKHMQGIVKSRASLSNTHVN